MEREPREQTKVQAVYDVREAAEKKARAEVALDEAPTRAARDALLDAQLDLEAKTEDAIAACHECGHEHGPRLPHDHSDRIGKRQGNLVDVDFKPRP